MDKIGQFLRSLSLSTRLAIATVAFGGTASLLQASIYNVDAGERAVLFNKLYGIQDEALGEGSHFRVPILEQAVIYDIRSTPQLVVSSTGSKDLQSVEITLRILFRPDPVRLKHIYQTFGMKLGDKILNGIGNEVLKSVVAQFDAGELITQREAVSLKIRESLTKRADSFGIILEDVSIVHISFSKDFMHAIEQKQVAQQVAERQKFLVDKSKQEKLAEVILVEGETEAARLIMEAMQTGNEFLQLRRIEAAKDIAQQLSQSRNVIYLPQNGNVLLNLPQQL